MAGFVTAFPTSAKAELAQALHNYTAGTGHSFKMALGKAAPVGTYDATTTNYSNVTGNSDEIPNGSGYTTGGYDFTAANNITPATSGTTAFWSWNVNPSWTSASFSTSGCLIYNATSGNRAVYVGSFGGTQQVTAGTFTVLLPTNNSTNAILRLQ